MSSHLLAEVEQVCDHLVMISGGRLVSQGDVADLLDSQDTELLARTERPEDLAALLALVHGTGHEARIDEGTLVVSADLDWAGDLNRLAARAQLPLVHLSERRPTLEEAFFELTGGASNDATVRSRWGRSDDDSPCVPQRVGEAAASDAAARNVSGSAQHRSPPRW